MIRGYKDTSIQANDYTKIQVYKLTTIRGYKDTSIQANTMI